MTEPTQGETLLRKRCKQWLAQVPAPSDLLEALNDFVRSEIEAASRVHLREKLAVPSPSAGELREALASARQFIQELHDWIHETKKAKLPPFPHFMAQTATVKAICDAALRAPAYHIWEDWAQGRCCSCGWGCGPNGKGKATAKVNKSTIKSCRTKWEDHVRLVSIRARRAPAAPSPAKDVKRCVYPQCRYDPKCEHDCAGKCRRVAAMFEDRPVLCNRPIGHEGYCDYMKEAAPPSPALQTSADNAGVTFKQEQPIDFAQEFFNFGLVFVANDGSEHRVPCEEHRNLRVVAAQPSPAAEERTPLLCAYQMADGQCGQPMLLDRLSYSGYRHQHSADWMHWATPVPYGLDSDEPTMEKVLKLCEICGKRGPENIQHLQLDGHAFVAAQPSPAAGQERESS